MCRPAHLSNCHAENLHAVYQAAWFHCNLAAKHQPSPSASRGNDEHRLELIVQLEMEANFMLSCVFANQHKPLFYAVVQQRVVKHLQKWHRYKWREIPLKFIPISTLQILHSFLNNVFESEVAGSY